MKPRPGCRVASPGMKVSLIALCLAASAASILGVYPQDTMQQSRFFEGRWFLRNGPVLASERQALRAEARGMFFFAYQNYLQHGFPKDDLRPMSCRGHDSQGGLSITLIDALDTLLVMGGEEQLASAVHWLQANLRLDLDVRIHVFELTIRTLGGLLSTHVLLKRAPEMVPGYTDGLLVLATELADRLLPAFDTPSGVPLSWVNLKRGVLPGETRVTCTACAGTLLLEFGLLSRLTGNPLYESRARHAAMQVYDVRSTATGLPGNTLNVDTLSWARYDSSVGAGIDSFYEYLLKAYLLLGDEEYLDAFAHVYAAAMRHLRPSEPGWEGRAWLGEVHMHSGGVMRPWISSLAAFWPGLQALVGQTEDAASLHGNWTAAWSAFGWLPELFDASVTQRHPLQTGYPLRPELMESTFLLHAATGDTRLLQAGRALQSTLVERNRARCGYASVADVATGALEDTMESFFLSETVKYLYLLWSDAAALPDFYLLSTEGHLMPPIHLSSDSALLGGSPLSGFDVAANSSAAAAGVEGVEAGEPGSAGVATPGTCAALCAGWAPGELTRAQDALRAAFPALPLDTRDALLLRQRRCTACRAVTRAMADMASQRAAEAEQARSCSKGQCSQPAAQAIVAPQIMCRLKAEDDGRLGCYELEVLADLPPAKVTALPPDTVIVQFTPAQLQGVLNGMPQQQQEQQQQELEQQELQPGSLGSPLGVVPGEPTVELLVWRSRGQEGEQEAEVEVQHFMAAGATFGLLPWDDSPCNADNDTLDSPSRCAVGATGLLVEGVPQDGCSPLINAADVAGGIVVLDRGSCMFAKKVVHAEAAGAVAVAIVSNEDTWMPMGEDGVHWPTIPSAHLPRSEGAALRQAMRAAAAAGEAARGELRLLQAPDQAPGSGACPVPDSVEEPGQAQLVEDSPQQCRVQELDDDGGSMNECASEPSAWEQESCSVEGEGSGGGNVQSAIVVEQLEDGGPAGEQQEGGPAGKQLEGVRLEGLATEGLAAQLGVKEARSAALGAMAAAHSALADKRVDVLIPPQAATWLQEAPQLGRALDVKAAVNGMLMHLAKASLTDHMREVAAAAMALQQRLQAGEQHAAVANDDLRHDLHQSPVTEAWEKVGGAGAHEQEPPAVYGQVPEDDCTPSEASAQEDFMKVSPEAPMGSPSEHQATTAASPSKVCFEDEAEVVPADKPLYFDAPGCVHADRPQAVSVLEGNSTDPDPEASSLVGSDDEYAFVYERPAGVDSPAKDCAAAFPSRGEPAQDSTLRKQAPLVRPVSPSLSLSMNPIQTPPPSLSPNLSPNLGPSMDPSCSSCPSLTLDIHTKTHPNSMGPDSSEATVLPERMAEAGHVHHSQTTLTSATPAAAPPAEGWSVVAPGGGTDTDADTGKGAEERWSPDVEEDQEQASARGAPSVKATVMSSEGSGEAGGMVELHEAVKGDDVASKRRRSLDRIGVIPGGRAAFGAQPPEALRGPPLPSAPSTRSGDGGGVIPGGRAAFGAQTLNPSGGGGGTLETPALRAGALARTRMAGGLGGSAAAAGAAAGRSGNAAWQRQASAAAAAAARRFSPLVLRGLEARPVASVDVLDRFDRLWHGGGGIVASQS